MKTWKLILDQKPLPGALNMAVDEFIFLSLDANPGTVVRFYTWAKPTVSLGARQDGAKVLDEDFCRRKGIDVVRRMTGGKLVLHDQEVTYAVASSDTEIFGHTLAGSYRLISQALLQGLKKMGIPAALAGETSSEYARGQMPCFSQPARDELEVGGRKIVGSAQKREGTKFLQHGSIPLSHDEDLLRKVSSPSQAGKAVTMTSISRELDRKADCIWAASRLAEGMAEFFQVKWMPWTLSEDDWAVVRSISKDKYENALWTRLQSRS